MRMILSVLSATLLTLLLPTIALTDVNDSKLDDQVDQGDQFVAVFVRMGDQMFAAGGDYERFCDQQPATTKRLELREQVIKTLREKADQAFKKVNPTVKQLIANGQLRNLQRYWIVNGFACKVTGKAAQSLARLESVAFIYRQRQAPQHQKPAVGDEKTQKKQRGLHSKILAKYKDDTDQPWDASKYEIPWNLKRIGADRAWDGSSERKGYTGRGVVVAVLDSGMMSIPALTSALWVNSDETLNGQDDDHNGYVDDVFGYDFRNNHPYTVDITRPSHGTLCAGIIAGRPADRRRKRPIVTGVAPRAKVMPLVGLGHLRAYEYAVSNGADVLSMSYTWDSQPLGHYRGLVRTAHEHLAAAGVVSVGGAGNYARSRPEGWQIGTPKDIPCVIAAAGVTENGEVAPASSRGPVSWKNVRYFDAEAGTEPKSKPDVTGCFGGYPMWTRADVWSETKWERMHVIHTDDAGYMLVIGPRGNSFSGPHAAGVAALMLEASPDLPVWHLKRLMESTCSDIGPAGRDTTFGAGLLQADKAVEAALSF